MIVYIGTYTFKGGEGIYCLDVTKDGFTSLGGTYAENPSYLCLSADKKKLYAAIETGKTGNEHGGAVRSYQVGENGALTYINEQGTKGAGTCHVSTDPSGKWLFAANYSEGSFSVFPLAEDGSILPLQKHIVHHGKGMDEKRQEKPHVHFTSITPDGTHLALCDLGLDGVYLYPFTAKDGISEACEKLPLPGGEGPRHLTFSADGQTMYLLTEMGAHLYVFRNDSGAWKRAQCIDTLTDDFTGLRWGAAVKLSPNGKFVVTSNRGHDSLTVFAVNPDGTLRKLQNIPSGGKTPRDFAFTPDGTLVVVAHQDEGGVTLFTFDQNTGTLADTGKRIDIGLAVGVLALN